MNINYQKECQRIIEDIKYKLSKLYLNDDEKSKYLRNLIDIERNINKPLNEFKYYEEFLKAVKIEEELSKIIYTRTEDILPPVEEETFLKNQINNQTNELNKHKIKTKKMKLNLVSYILTLSVLLSAGTYTVMKGKNTPKEKLYYTENKTYYLKTHETRSTHEYLKAIENNSEVIIKKIDPWTINDEQASRKTYIYHIKNMSYTDLLATDDFEKIIANLTYDEQTEYTETRELQDKFKYTESIFEITEIIQSKDKYIEKKSIAALETILALFTELLVYLLLLKVNEGPLFESILKTIRNVNSTNKIIAINESTTKLLNDQYNMVSAKKKTLKI